MEVHSGYREGAASSLPRTVIGLTGSSGREGRRAHLGRATWNRQGEEKPGREPSTKPSASESPGTGRMEVQFQ